MIFQVCETKDCPADHLCHSIPGTSKIKACVSDFCDPQDVSITYGSIVGNAQKKYDVNERARLVCHEGKTELIVEQLFSTVCFFVAL